MGYFIIYIGKNYKIYYEIYWQNLWDILFKNNGIYWVKMLGYIKAYIGQNIWDILGKTMLYCGHKLWHILGKTYGIYWQTYRIYLGI